MIIRKRKRENHVIFESEEEFREAFPGYSDRLLAWKDLPKSISNYGKGGRQNKAQKWGMPIITEHTIEDEQKFQDQWRKNREGGYVFEGRIYSISIFYEKLRERIGGIDTVIGKWIVGDDGSVQQILTLKEFKHNSGREWLNIVVVGTAMGYYPLYETTVMDKVYRGTSFTSKGAPKITKKQKEFMFNLVISRDLVFAFKKSYPYYYERIKGDINKIMVFLRRKILTDLFMQELTKALESNDEIKKHLNENKGSLVDMLDLLVQMAHAGRDEKAKIMAAKEVIAFHKDSNQKVPNVTIYNTLSAPPAPVHQVEAEVVQDKQLENKP